MLPAFQRRRTAGDSAATTATPAAGRPTPRIVTALDERLPVSAGGSLPRKAFPEHWSFLLGELALYSLVGWCSPASGSPRSSVSSMAEVVYGDSYRPLDGVRTSDAYRSTLHISFDVRGGLLIRQLHHRRPWCSSPPSGCT